MCEVNVRALCLGDIVSLFDDAYGYGTVEKITEDEVHIFRPYVHTADFSMSAGKGSLTVISYIGTETVKLWKGDSRKINLIRKGEALK